MKYIFKFLWFVFIHTLFLIAVISERIYAVLYCILSILWNLKISKTKSFRRLTYYRFGDGEDYYRLDSMREIERKRRVDTFSSFTNLYKAFYKNFVKDSVYYSPYNKLHVDNNFELATFNY